MQTRQKTRGSLNQANRDVDIRGLFGRARRVRGHDFGLVGFVKQLVDELRADAYTHPSRGSRETNWLPRFRSMEFIPGQVFIVKASPEDDASCASTVWSHSLDGNCNMLHKRLASACLEVHAKSSAARCSSWYGWHPVAR